MKLFGVAVIAAFLCTGTYVGAEESTAPATTTFPRLLSLSDARKMFRDRGYDLIIAQAQVAGAEADVLSQSASPNPAIFGNVATAVGSYNDSCAGCSRWGFGVGLTDQGALFDAVQGKKSLRSRVATAAVNVAKSSKEDALRVLDAQIKSQYVEVAAAKATLDFAIEVGEAATKSLELNRLRFPKVIDEGTLARVETTKLQADQAIDLARDDLRAARVALAFSLGHRGDAPEFDVDKNVLNFTVPLPLAKVNPDGLVADALRRRPDVRSATYAKEAAEAARDLAARRRVPDIALNAQYTQQGTGQNAIQPPTVMFGLVAPLPLFYTFRGEIERAEADQQAFRAQREKTEARVSAEVRTAWSRYQTAKGIVERYENGLLDRAKRARDITELQFNSGSAPLLNFLDAQRTYISSNVDYLNSLAAYWAAVFQLEAAVASDLK